MIARFLEWRRYRRIRALLISQTYELGYTMTSAALSVIEAQARAQARAGRWLP